MAEIRSGFSWASLLAWLGIIGIVIFLAWSAVNKRSESNDYTKGAVHNEYVVTEHNYPLSLHPCGALFDIKGLQQEKTGISGKTEVKK